jgi:hypothetical protein
MRRLSDAELLRVCEQGRLASRAWRAMAMLGAATGDPDGVTALTPGGCDAQLLALRQLTFGATLECVTRCPACGESLEFSLESEDLVSAARGAPRLEVPLTVAADGYQAALRLPTLGDLEALEVADDQALLASCLVSVEREGRGVSARELPRTVVAAIDRRLAEADPGAVLEVSLDCPACQHVWEQLFDVEAFFWAEIQAQAERLLREVDGLARAYGWSEREILGLPSARRQRYLELVGGGA